MNFLPFVLVHLILTSYPPPPSTCGCPKELIGGEHRIVRAKGNQSLSSFDVDPVTGNYYFGIWSETPPPKGQSDLTSAAQGQLFSSELRPLGPVHTFAAAKETSDGMAPSMFGVNFNSRDRQFLATWILTSGTPGDGSGELVGQLVSPTGAPFTDVRTILIFPAHPMVWPLKMVYNKAGNEYVLLYQIIVSNPHSFYDHLYLQRIDQSLTPVGTPVPVDPENRSTEWQELRLDPTTNRYLVTWQAYSADKSRIRAALFSSDLKRIQPPQTVAQTQGAPTTAFSASHRGFAVFWSDTTRSILARIVHPDGSMSGVFNTGTREYATSARANPVTGGFVLMVHGYPKILRLDHNFHTTQAPERISCGTVRERSIPRGLLFNPKAAEFLATWSYDYGAQLGGYDIYAARVRTVSAGSCSN